MVVVVSGCGSSTTGSGVVDRMIQGLLADGGVVENDPGAATRW